MEFEVCASLVRAVPSDQNLLTEYCVVAGGEDQAAFLGEFEAGALSVGFVSVRGLHKIVGRYPLF